VISRIDQLIESILTNYGNRYSTKYIGNRIEKLTVQKRSKHRSRTGLKVHGKTGIGIQRMSDRDGMRRLSVTKSSQRGEDDYH
jgi:hypothetical protein